MLGIYTEPTYYTLLSLLFFIIFSTMSDFLERKRNLIIAGGVLVFEFIFGCYFPEYVNGLAVIISPMCFFFISGKWIHRLFTVFLSDAIVTLFEMLSVSSIFSIWPQKDSSTNHPAVILLAMVIVFILIKKGKFGAITKTINSFSAWKRILIIVLIYLTAYTLADGLLILDFVPAETMRYYFLLELFMILAEIAVYVIVYTEAKGKILYQQSDEMKAMVIDEQKLFYELLLAKSEDTRKFRHDISNHLGVLQSLLSKGETEDAVRYLGHMVDENESLRVKNHYFGDDILDTVIGMACYKAKEKNIDIVVNGNLLVEKNDVYDLCYVFQNAIGNAVEACERLHVKGPITVNAKSSNAMTVIQFRNPASQEMYENLMSGTTSKADSQLHGIGVTNIKSAASRLGAECKYSFENEMVILELTKEN